MFRIKLNNPECLSTSLLYNKLLFISPLTSSCDNDMKLLIFHSFSSQCNICVDCMLRIKLNITPWMFIHFQAVQCTVVYFPADKFIREPHWQQSVVTENYWYHYSRSNWSSWRNQWTTIASIIRNGAVLERKIYCSYILNDEGLSLWCAINFVPEEFVPYQHTEAEPKWLPFCRQCFHTCCLEWKLLNSN